MTPSRVGGVKNVEMLGKGPNVVLNEEWRSNNHLHVSSSSFSVSMEQGRSEGGGMGGGRTSCFAVAFVVVGSY